VVLLDTRNRVIGISEVYKGSLNSAMVRVGEVFREAIRRNSAAIVVVHNHPSSDPSPSTNDVSLTTNIREAGKLIDIELLDHLIFAGNTYVSLKERRLGFP
jgi:DNA repair protein RadC